MRVPTDAYLASTKNMDVESAAYDASYSAVALPAAAASSASSVGHVHAQSPTTRASAAASPATADAASAHSLGRGQSTGYAELSRELLNMPRQKRLRLSATFSSVAVAAGCASTNARAESAPPPGMRHSHAPPIAEWSDAWNAYSTAVRKLAVSRAASTPRSGAQPGSRARVARPHVVAARDTFSAGSAFHDSVMRPQPFVSGQRSKPSAPCCAIFAPAKRPASAWPVPTSSAASSDSSACGVAGPKNCASSPKMGEAEYQSAPKAASSRV